VSDGVEDRAASVDTSGLSLGRAKPILTEVLDAARSAAEAILDEQKQRAAKRIAGIAAAVQCAAQALEPSDSRAIAGWADQAAGRIDDFARLLRDRRWSDIAADGEDFARRQPMLFVVGATVAGFLAGRLLSLPPDRGQRPDRRRPDEEISRTPDLAPHRGETDEIIAAVSKLAMPPPGSGKIAGAPKRKSKTRRRQSATPIAVDKTRDELWKKAEEVGHEAADRVRNLAEHRAHVADG
jgi:hypothetical protein